MSSNFVNKRVEKLILITIILVSSITAFPFVKEDNYKIYSISTLFIFFNFLKTDTRFYVAIGVLSAISSIKEVKNNIYNFYNLNTTDSIFYFVFAFSSFLLLESIKSVLARRKKDGFWKKGEKPNWPNIFLSVAVMSIISSVWILMAFKVLLPLNRLLSHLFIHLWEWITSFFTHSPRT